MRFKPTSECPMYPAHFRRPYPSLPLPDLTDDQVDAWISALKHRYGSELNAARTQFGRRTQVDTYLRQTKKERDRTSVAH